MVSVLMPARCEKYLEKTIRNVLENGDDIEIIVVLDGWLPDPAIEINDPRVKFIHYKEVIGQRAAINNAAKVARGKFIMKLDAHCAVAPHFDTVLSNDCEYDVTMIPRMYNLDIDTWKPKFFDDFNHAVRMGKLHDYLYLSMNEKGELRTNYYTNGNVTLHTKRKDILIDETMSCMGPCFFMHKDRFWELGGCDEGHEGGWGQQAVEVSCKAWLSGGRLLVNKKTWFAHWFRGDIGFPYPISGNQIDRVRRYSTDLWVNDKWVGQKRKFQWLMDKFNPPTNTTQSDLTVIYLTMNKLPKKWQEFQLKHLKNAIEGYSVISVSREPMKFGVNLIDVETPSYWNIYMQILRACKIATTPYIAIAEDDVLYTSEHFSNFRPPMDAVSFDRSRWSLFSWDKEPIFCLRQRVSNCSVIAPRLLMIEALEERKNKYPDGLPNEKVGEVGRERIERRLGLTLRKSVDWYCHNPIVQLNHLYGNDTGKHERLRDGRIMIKKHGQIKAVEIPYWGRASDIVREYL